MFIRKLVLALGVGIMMVGCAYSARAPVLGLIYTGVSAGEAATSAPTPTKRGEACATSILGWVATGDASIDAAAKQGGIETVSYVDGDSTSILGIYAEYCTVVYGQ